MTIDWSPPFPDIATLLAVRLREAGHRPCLTYRNPATGERTELGYATFENWVAKTADALAEEGVEGGDEILVATAGHWTGAVVVWACALLGARARPSDRATGAGERLGADPPRVAVLHERHVEAVGAHEGRALLVGDGLGGRPSPGADGDAFTDLALGGADEFDGDPPELDTPWLVLDDATTLTQRNVLAAASALEGWGLGADDRVLLTTPLERPPAAVLAVSTLVLGGAVVAVTDGAPPDWAAAVAEERATWMLVDPEGVDRCATGDVHFDGLRGILCLDPASEATAAEVRLRHDVEVCLGSGIVEAGCVASLTPRSLDAATAAWLAEQSGRAGGRILPPADLEERNGRLLVVGPLVEGREAHTPGGPAGHVRIGPGGGRYVVLER